MTPSPDRSGSRYVLLFLLFSVIGWLYEVGLALLYGYGFINRGFLLGPWLPLYGCGALLLILCLQNLIVRPLRAGPVSLTPLLVFLLIILITTTLEYAVGYLLELIFDMRWWDYSTYRFQLHGRICLSASLRFGLGGMLFLYVLTPLFTALIGKLPSRLRKTLAWLVVFILLLDLLLTLYLASQHGFDPTLSQPR